MPFDLAEIEKRFAWIPTDLHQFDEQHKAVEAELVSTAKSLASLIPYGQEAEDVVNTLVLAGHSAHAAIDRIASAGTIKVGGKVVQEASPASEGQGGEQEAAVVDTPPSAPQAPASDPTQTDGASPSTTTATPPAAAAPAPSPEGLKVASEPTAEQKEGFVEHLEHEVEDFLHVGEKDVATAETVLGAVEGDKPPA